MLAFTFIFESCAPIKNSQFSEFLSLKYEPPECTTTSTFTNNTTLSGTAKFYKRGVNLIMQSGELKNMTMGDPLATPLPIKFAEVAVFNADNTIIQCGKTNAAGEIKAVDGVSDLKIPALATTFTVRVYARSNHTLSFAGKPDFSFNVAVKHDKYTNELYSIAGQVISNGTDDSSVNLVAFARQTDSIAIEGGAFNILNSLLTAYDFINNNTGTVDTTCLTSKLSVYWKAGFNPAQYYYPNLDPETITNTSFYDIDSASLYITGGRLGNMSIEPAHQFDDYVIMHELGHRIEHVCGSLLNPGGDHFIITRSDPRLTWAEGWSNYFAAQVMHDSISSVNPEFTNKAALAGLSNTAWTYFFGSIGFSDSVQNIGSGSGFMFDLKKAGNNPDAWQFGSFFGQPFDKVDATKFPGEGHFREGAITRGLFKLANSTCGAFCISAAPVLFESYWKALDKITGIGQSQFKFKSSASFLELVKTFTTWDAAKINFNQSTTGEALHLFSDGSFTSAGINRWVPYGTYLTTITGGACAAGSYYIEPRSDDPVLTGTNSDQRYSNHFYTIDLNQLTGLDELSVTFTKITAGGTTTEFDILLFQENYFFNGDYFCPSLDANNNCKTDFQPSRSTTADVIKSDRRSGNFATKTIKNLQQLDKTKKYLLNIRAYTANKSINSLTDYQYNITNQNGANICP